MFGSSNSSSSDSWEALENQSPRRAPRPQQHCFSPSAFLTPSPPPLMEERCVWSSLRSPCHDFPAGPPLLRLPRTPEWLTTNTTNDHHDNNENSNNNNNNDDDMEDNFVLEEESNQDDILEYEDYDTDTEYEEFASDNDSDTTLELGQQVPISTNTMSSTVVQERRDNNTNNNSLRRQQYRQQQQEHSDDTASNSDNDFDLALSLRALHETLGSFSQRSSHSRHGHSSGRHHHSTKPAVMTTQQHPPATHQDASPSSAITDLYATTHSHCDLPGSLPISPHLNVDYTADSCITSFYHGPNHLSVADNMISPRRDTSLSTTFSSPLTQPLSSFSQSDYLERRVRIHRIQQSVAKHVGGNYSKGGGAGL